MSNALRLTILASTLLVGGAALAYDDSGRFPSTQAQTTGTANEARCTTKRVQARDASGAVIWKQQRTCR
jgi:hypothetical protein